MDYIENMIYLHRKEPEAAADPASADSGVEAIKKLVVGSTVDSASAAVQQIGWSLRVMRQDGESFFVTLDYDPSRVNVEVVAGKITAVTSVG